MLATCSRSTRNSLEFIGVYVACHVRLKAFYVESAWAGDRTGTIRQNEAEEAD